MRGSFRKFFLRFRIWLGFRRWNRRVAAINSGERWSGFSKVIILESALPFASAVLVGSDCCHDSLYTREVVAYCVW